MNYITIRKSLLFLIVMLFCSNFFSGELLAGDRPSNQRPSDIQICIGLGGSSDESSEDITQLQIYKHSSAKKCYELVDKDNNPSNDFSLTRVLRGNNLVLEKINHKSYNTEHAYDSKDFITLVTLIKKNDGYFLKTIKSSYFRVEQSGKIILKEDFPGKAYCNGEKTNLTEKQALWIKKTLKEEAGTEPIAMDQENVLYLFCEDKEDTKVKSLELEIYTHKNVMSSYRAITKDGVVSHDISLRKNGDCLKKIQTSTAASDKSYDGNGQIYMAVLIKRPEGYFIKRKATVKMHIGDDSKIILGDLLLTITTWPDMEKVNLTERQADWVKNCLASTGADNQTIAIDLAGEIYNFIAYQIETKEQTKAIFFYGGCFLVIGALILFLMKFKQ